MKIYHFQDHYVELVIIYIYIYICYLDYIAYESYVFIIISMF